MASPSELTSSSAKKKGYKTHPDLLICLHCLGEMLVGPARALFMDEISTGLDSSTTYQIVNSLRQTIHILGGTAVISLLQPAPETYNLFDDIILLSDGHVVYQGPREHVLEFFEFMGFRCPARKGVADFLQEVCA
jgi:ABC-type multidrug transport system ATPase subunit